MWESIFSNTYLRSYLVINFSKHLMINHSFFSHLVQETNQIWYLDWIMTCLQGLKISLFSFIRQLEKKNYFGKNHTIFFIPNCFDFSFLRTLAINLITNCHFTLIIFIALACVLEKIDCFTHNTYLVLTFKCLLFIHFVLEANRIWRIRSLMIVLLEY